MQTARLGPPRKLYGKRRERFDRGQCMNGGCTVIGRYRDTMDCFRCWAGVKWTSVIQRVTNVNGKCRSYVGSLVLFTKESFIQWVIDNPPPKSMARPSVDRIYPKLGYIPGNIRWIEMRVNASRKMNNVE